MFRKHVKDQNSAAALNITQLIDMVFILLVFFAVNASFVKEAGVEVDRPSAKSAVSQDKANILIAITKQGQVWIDQKRVDVRSVRGHVERLHA